MLTTQSVYYVMMMMVSAHVQLVSLGNGVINVMMVGTTSPAMVVSLVDVSSWEVNRLFVIKLLECVPALMELLVICVMLVLWEPS